MKHNVLAMYSAGGTVRHPTTTIITNAIILAVNCSIRPQGIAMTRSGTQH